MQIPYPSPYDEQTQKAFVYLKELDADTKWVHYSDTNGIKIWTQTPPDNVSMPMTKGHTTVESLTPFDVFSAVCCPATRAVWDERFEGINPLEYYGPRSIKFQSTQKGTFPVAGREFVGVQSWNIEDGTYYLVQYSVDAPSVPIPYGKVRGFIHLAGWIIAPTETGTSITYIARVDIKGTVPSAILRLVVAGTPGCVGTVKKFIGDHGLPPQFFSANYRKGLQTLGETYSSTAGYTINIAAKEGAEKDDSIYFALPNVTYGAGAKVEVSGATGAVEVVLAEEGDALVPKVAKAFVVKPTGVAGEVTIKVTKTSSGSIVLA